MLSIQKKSLSMIQAATKEDFYNWLIAFPEYSWNANQISQSSTWDLQMSCCVRYSFWRYKRKEKATNTHISEARSNKYLAFLLLPIDLKHQLIIQIADGLFFFISSGQTPLNFILNSHHHYAQCHNCLQIQMKDDSDFDSGLLLSHELDYKQSSM